jgi:hypothetical protein
MRDRLPPHPRGARFTSAPLAYTVTSAQGHTRRLLALDHLGTRAHIYRISSVRARSTGSQRFRDLVLGLPIPPLISPHLLLIRLPSLSSLSSTLHNRYDYAQVY